jgi:hypothetical protein
VIHLFKKENAKQGTHFWLDVNIPQSNDSCYFAESDALVI